jgi:hypothetical protein
VAGPYLGRIELLNVPQALLRQLLGPNVSGDQEGRQQERSY